MAGDDMTALEAWRKMAMAENKRAQRNWQGLENDNPVTLREIRRVAKTKPEELRRTKALRMRIQRLHLDGLYPDEITVQLACPEAMVWKYLRILYQEGSKLSDDYRHLRVSRIYALKQQGLALPDIAARMGVNKVLLNKDMREMPQEQARAAVGCENTGRNQNG